MALILMYGNIDELLEVYEFSVNIHCDCSECDGVSSYKDITISEVNKKSNE